MIFSRVEEEERSCRYLHISLTPSPPPSPEPFQPEAENLKNYCATNSGSHEVEGSYCSNIELSGLT
jgi:hypothetical protein